MHYSGSLALCIGVGGCETVQTSQWSMIGDVPVALLGLLGYVAILAVAAGRLWRPSPSLDLALFALSLAATAYVAYLSYVEVFVLGAICPWCVSVAICSVLIFALVARELFSSAS